MPNPKPYPQNTCPKHGTEAIEWKCKFCCSVASWFCWGTTHFCDDCHRKQVLSNSNSSNSYYYCWGTTHFCDDCHRKQVSF